MNKTFARVVGALTATLISTVAYAQDAAQAVAPDAACVTPTPPAPITLVVLQKPARPTRPDCFANNRCRDPDVKRYNTQVETFNQALFAYDEGFDELIAQRNEYNAAMNRYVNAVNRYTDCEDHRLDELLDRSR